MEYSTYLVKAMQMEDILIKLDDRLFIPGIINSKAQPSISLDNTVFSLEECATADDLEASFFNGESQAIKDIRQEILMQAGDLSVFNQRGHSLETNLLEFIVKVFLRLKPDIGYGSYLKIDKSRFFFPDADRLRREFQGEDISELATKKTEIEKFYRPPDIYLPSHCIFMSGAIYELVKNREGDNRISVSLEKNTKLFPKFMETIGSFKSHYKYEIIESVKSQISSGTSEERKRLERMRRYALLKKFEDEDFLSHGLLIQGPESSYTNTELKAVMVLPEMAIPIPGSSMYLRFAQAYLSSNVIIQNQNNHIGFSPIYYNAETQHPLVYQKRHVDGYRIGSDMVGQVCLREAVEEVHEGYAFEPYEQLARLFLINRKTVMYAANLTNIVDDWAILRDFSLNPHSVKRWRFRQQRVDREYIEENNVLVIGDV